MRTIMTIHLAKLNHLGILLITQLLIVFPVFAGESGGGHTDPVAPLLLALIAILMTAKLGGALFERFGQPAVLGELLGGVLLGNLGMLHAGWDFFGPLRGAGIEIHWAVVVDSLARLGVIVLLFEVGLETSVTNMMKVGKPAMLVALLGVFVPMILGFGVSFIFIKELPATLVGIVPPEFNLHYVHMFMGAILCATSVGITARVFKDLHKLHTKEAQIILGAAVIDDVLGLIILTVVSGIITAAEMGQTMKIGALFNLFGMVMLFLSGSLAIGIYFIPKIMKHLARLRTAGMMLITALLLVFTFSYVANATGLATIVGAFAAGLIMERVHFSHFNEKHTIEEMIHPIATFLVPIFFVLMGVQVRLETFLNPTILGVAAGLTVAAIIGKQICGLGVWEKGVNRMTIGIGMIPRGEVGLIFASIGKELKVIDNSTYSAVVIMVIVTTLVTPPLLKWSLGRSEPVAPTS